MSTSSKISVYTIMIMMMMMMMEKGAKKQKWDVVPGFGFTLFFAFVSVFICTCVCVCSGSFACISWFVCLWGKLVVAAEIRVTYICLIFSLSLWQKENESNNWKFSPIFIIACGLWMETGHWTWFFLCLTFLVFSYCKIWYQHGFDDTVVPKNPSPVFFAFWLSVWNLKSETV